MTACAVVALELRDALHVGVEQRDVVVHELDRVAVAGADEHVEALLGALRGERGEDVVGLDVLLLEDR